MSENVLVHTPALASNEASGCLDFLTDTPPDQSNLLIVSYVRSPDQWLQMWSRHVDELPANLGFIFVGDTMRSASAQAGGGTSPSQSVVTAVANPTDLTGLGIKLSEYLTEWEGNGNQTVVCFDSITSLLQYTDSVQTTYRFLHTLVGRIQAADARACYTITPTAHDAQTMATLSGLFDRVIEGQTDSGENRSD